MRMKTSRTAYTLQTDAVISFRTWITFLSTDTASYRRRLETVPRNSDLAGWTVLV